MMMDRESLSEWAKDKPLSILQLDPADRAVLRIAGKSIANNQLQSRRSYHVHKTKIQFLLYYEMMCARVHWAKIFRK